MSLLIETPVDFADPDFADKLRVFSADLASSRTAPEERVITIQQAEFVIVFLNAWRDLETAGGQKLLYERARDLTALILAATTTVFVREVPTEAVPALTDTFFSMLHHNATLMTSKLREDLVARGLTPVVPPKGL